MNEDTSITIYGDYTEPTSLGDLIAKATKLCAKNDIVYNPYKIGVCTDYGTGVVIYLIEDE